MFKTICKVNYVKSRGNYTYGHEGGHCALCKEHNGDGSIRLDIGMAPGVKVLCVLNRKIGYEYYIEDVGFEKILEKEIKRRKKSGKTWYYPDFTLKELQWVYNPLPHTPLINEISLDLFKEIKKNGFYKQGQYNRYEYHDLYKVPWEKVYSSFIDNESDSFIGEKDFCYVWSNSYDRNFLSYEDYKRYKG